MRALNRQKPLVLRDEVHGDISFDRLFRAVIDHECVQRLRYIKQLGLAEYVFPCATHTRFQHCIGASYLAQEYFDGIMESWLSDPFRFNGKVNETEFYAEKTAQLFQKVASHPPSYEFWKQMVGLAALLHDVGHGPWSHSFETLDLEQDFSSVIAEVSEPIQNYFKTKLKKGQTLAHEDISVLYVHRIFSDLEKEKILKNSQLYFLCVASLINAKLSWRDETKKLDEAIEKSLESAGYHGGADFHRLMRAIISGPFDVDRMDYIQRDARNTGVHIGGIEWPRIVKKLIPVLANHQGNTSEPKEVVLISKVKNQHVLDDFMFSLFQMYAQVYMHPKIVGLEESIREILEAKRPKKGELIIDFDTHCSLSDEKFRGMLDERFGIKEVNDLLYRRKGARFKVASFPLKSGLNIPLKKEHYTLLNTQARAMMKDSMGVFLYQAVGENGGAFGNKGYFVQPWVSVSPISAHFHGVQLNPEVWVRREE